MRKHGKHHGRDKICNDKEPLEPTDTNQTTVDQLTNAIAETNIRQPVVSTSFSSFEQTQSPTRSASSPGTFS